MVVCRARGCRSGHVGTAHRWPTPAPLGATTRLRLHVGRAAAVPPAAPGAAASAILALDSRSSGCEFVDLKGEERRPFCYSLFHLVQTAMTAHLFQQEHQQGGLRVDAS